MTTSFWVGKRVFLTGHTGFKGSWMSVWLNKLGAIVSGYSLSPETTSNLYSSAKVDELVASSYLNDIRDSHSLNKALSESCPDIIFHFAAQPLVLQSYNDPVSTWETNVNGTLNLLQAIKNCQLSNCVVIVITTDKVYLNKESLHGYNEDDKLGGKDPYSSSKAAVELLVSSWRHSFYSDNFYTKICSARAGNVIGGGDWSDNRIVPDIVRSLSNNTPIPVRNKYSTRPWQHVIDPLSGYLLLAEITYNSLGSKSNLSLDCYNFGPTVFSNQSVQSLVEECLKSWKGEWVDKSDPNAPHEASRLHLQIDKSYHELNWQPKWNFEKTVQRTMNWYQDYNCGHDARDLCLADIAAYELE